MTAKSKDKVKDTEIEFRIHSGSDQVMLDNKVLPVKQWLAQETNQDRAKIAYHTPNGSIKDSRDV